MKLHETDFPAVTSHRRTSRANPNTAATPARGAAHRPPLFAQILGFFQWWASELWLGFWKNFDYEESDTMPEEHIRLYGHCATCGPVEVEGKLWCGRCRRDEIADVQIVREVW